MWDSGCLRLILLKVAPLKSAFLVNCFPKRLVNFMIKIKWKRVVRLTQFCTAKLNGSFSMRFSIFNKKEQQIFITTISDLMVNEYRGGHSSGLSLPWSQKKSKTGQSLLYLTIPSLALHSECNILLPNTGNELHQKLRFKAVPGADVLQV